MSGIAEINNDDSTKLELSRPDGADTAAGLIAPPLDEQQLKAQEQTQAQEQSTQQAQATGRGSIINELA